MRERSVHLKSLGYLGGNVHADTGLTPEAAGYWDLDKQRRIDALADDGGALCFGRIDRADDERFYIGRRHVEDGDGEPVVTDWRAPTATPFYRATVADRMGLRRRRRFLVEGSVLVDILDEDLEHPSERDAGAYVPDPLLAEIERARTGEMRDIVATIQAEQDVIIRAPLECCVVVQGGPGTGKTAVGLHRAAFLLYEHRELLERERLLIVGPNKVFFRYISQVLPSLGERASAQLTVEGLAGARFRVRTEEDPARARLKGDARMATVLRRAAQAGIVAPDADPVLSTTFGSVTLAVSEVSAIIQSALAGERPLNAARETVRQQLGAAAWKAYRAKPTATTAEATSFRDDMRTNRDLRALLDRVWPAVTSTDLVRRLYGNRRLMERAADGLLTKAERDALYRKATARIGDEQWSLADLAILDEAEAISNGVAQRYGHIVVDEAQDLSAMELRMIARRSRRGSMTVLGDLAQATAPGGQSTWDAAIGHLAAATSHYDELTVGYRVPAPILEFANRLLPEAAPGVAAATSARQRGVPPRLVGVDLVDRAATVAAETAELASRWESVAVVVPDEWLDEIAAALDHAGVSFVNGRRRSTLGEHVTLLPPPMTKGLEFDAVLAVEPADIMATYPNGGRLLYVVLTRAVQHVSIVHAHPLPAALTSA